MIAQLKPSITISLTDEAAKVASDWIFTRGGTRMGAYVYLRSLRITTAYAIKRLYDDAYVVQEPIKSVYMSKPIDKAVLRDIYERLLIAAGGRVVIVHEGSLSGDSRLQRIRYESVELVNMKEGV